VNIARLLTVIKEKTKKKGKPFVVFFDFSAAYNSILHKQLFDELRQHKLLEEEEIQFMEGLYSRL